MKIAMRKAGFTMLELLAVLAIVLILGAILFPAIESAREKSLTTACSQNVKQLVLAIIQYEQDQKALPAARLYINALGGPVLANPPATNMKTWMNQIASYMHADPNAGTRLGAAASAGAPIAAPALAGLPPGDADALYPESFRCPSVANWNKAGQNTSYGYNKDYAGDADPATVLTAAAAGLQPGFPNYPITKGSIQRPDRMLIVADSDGTGFTGYVPAAPATTAAATPAAPSVFQTGAFGYILDPTFKPLRNIGGLGVLPLTSIAAGAGGATITAAAGGLIVDGAGNIAFNTEVAGTASMQIYRGVVSNRHKGSANVGFLDGHVESIVRERCYMDLATSASAPIAGITGNAGNRLFLSNALWNGFGIDNDLDGNGVVEAIAGERIIDPNEAWNVPAGGGGGGPIAINNVFQTGYDPQGLAAGTYGALAGLVGPNAAWGPGFDPNVAAFQTQEGPTIPHIAPFAIELDVAAQQ